MKCLLSGTPETMQCVKQATSCVCKPTLVKSSEQKRVRKTARQYLARMMYRVLKAAAVQAGTAVQLKVSNCWMYEQETQGCINRTMTPCIPCNHSRRPSSKEQQTIIHVSMSIPYVCGTTAAHATGPCCTACCTDVPRAVPRQYNSLKRMRHAPTAMPTPTPTDTDQLNMDAENLPPLSVSTVLRCDCRAVVNRARVQTPHLLMHPSCVTASDLQPLPIATQLHQTSCQHSRVASASEYGRCLQAVQFQ